MGLSSALVGACLVCYALVGACLVCSALVGACLVCSALAGACLVCSALAGACVVCSTLVGACLVCYALVGACVWIISFFQKSRQEKVVSVSGSQEGMESHGKINFGPHSSSLSPAESVTKGYSRTLCQIMEDYLLFGRIYCLRDGAPCGTRVQTSENFMSGPWTDAEVLGDLLQEGVYTITSARTLSTRHAYALKLNLFVEWCSSHREDPRSARSESYCPFCSSGWSEGCLPPSLNAYGAMIAANHDPVDGKLVGKHDWVIRFLRGARRLNPPRPPSIPSWDLSLVLRALQQGQFEPCKQSS